MLSVDNIKILMNQSLLRDDNSDYIIGYGFFNTRRYNEDLLEESKYVLASILHNLQIDTKNELYLSDLLIDDEGKGLTDLSDRTSLLFLNEFISYLSACGFISNDYSNYKENLKRIGKFNQELLLNSVVSTMIEESTLLELLKKYILPKMKYNVNQKSIIKYLDVPVIREKVNNEQNR